MMLDKWEYRVVLMVIVITICTIVLSILLILPVHAFKLKIDCDAHSMVTNPCQRVTQFEYPKDLKVGDIILFKITDEAKKAYGIKHDYWYHRIVYIRPDGYITKGDLNDDIDYFVVKKEAVKYKMTWLWSG